MGHPPWECHKYKDPVKIRDRLKQLRLCMVCAGRVHEESCPDHIKCHIHPGARHQKWTCADLDGHPGKQEPNQS